MAKTMLVGEETVTKLHSALQTEITKDVVKKADLAEFNAHVGNTTIHVTEAERSTWNNKADASKVYEKVDVNNLLSQKADLENGMVPASQLPSFVGDVLEYASSADFPTTGEAGKIYVALNTNLTYRWGGSTYVEISKSLALGETAETAYAGDKGKAAADEIAAHEARKDNPHDVTAEQVGAYTKKEIDSYLDERVPTSALTHTYTFGVNGASSDKFAKSLYAILSPLLLPYGTVKSVALMASDNVVVSGAKYMLLWAHDGSGSYSSSTCTFLGKSVEAVEQTASTLSTWRFEDVTLPKDRGLIIQLVPEDAAPSGDAWEWGADSGRFEVMSCKCQHGVYGNIINSNWKFNYNFIPYCEVTAATKPTAGKILTGNNVSETSLVGQTDAFAPVTRSGANTLKVDVAGLSPYSSTKAGHYGVVAVCSTASGYQKMNLGQSALADNSKELVILKPNQNGTHPGVVSPSATAIPADTVECPTVISGDKATIKAYAPKETDPKFTAWKGSNEIVAGMAASANNGNYSVVIGSSANTQENSYGAVAIGKEAEAFGAHATALGAYASAPDDGNDDSGNGIYTVGFPATEDHFYLNSSIHTAYEKKAYTLGSLLDKKAAKTDVVWKGVISGEDSGYMKIGDDGDPVIVTGATGGIYFSRTDISPAKSSTLFPDGTQVVTKNVLDAQGYATKSDLTKTVTYSLVNTSSSEYVIDMTQNDMITLDVVNVHGPAFTIKLPIPELKDIDAVAYKYSGVKRLIITSSEENFTIAGFIDTSGSSLYMLYETDSDGKAKDIRNEWFGYDLSKYPNGSGVLIEMIPVGVPITDRFPWLVRWSPIMRVYS